MGLEKQQGEGFIQKVKGKIQEAWGDLTGDDDTKAEGQANQAAGKVREKVGEAASGLKNLGEALVDKVDDAVHRKTDRDKPII